MPKNNIIIIIVARRKLKIDINNSILVFSMKTFKITLDRIPVIILIKLLKSPFNSL